MAIYGDGKHTSNEKEATVSLSSTKPEKKRFAIDYISTLYVYAESEQEAKGMWENANLGEGENHEINEIRIAQ